MIVSKEFKKKLLKLEKTIDKNREIYRKETVIKEFIPLILKTESRESNVSLYIDYKEEHKDIKLNKNKNGVEIDFNDLMNDEFTELNDGKVYEWSDGKEIKINIENIVFTANLGCKLNTSSLVLKLGHLGYRLHKKKFPAGIIKTSNPEVAILLFDQGI